MCVAQVGIREHHDDRAIGTRGAKVHLAHQAADDPRAVELRARLFAIEGKAGDRKAAAFGEAMTREFAVYQERVLENARVLAKVLQERGLRIVSGGTDCHMFLVDLRPKQLTGRDAEAALARAHITVNKNAIPNDPEKPFVTSGIRIGSPAVTTRGFGEIECEELGHLIADVLDAPEDPAVLTRTLNSVAALTRRFPVYRA